jgi:hypothetical protein
MPKTLIGKIEYGKWYTVSCVYSEKKERLYGYLDDEISEEKNEGIKKKYKIKDQEYHHHQNGILE